MSDLTPGRPPLPYGPWPVGDGEVHVWYTYPDRIDAAGQAARLELLSAEERGKHARLVRSDVRAWAPGR
jgi:hypothetical protein